RLSCDGNAPPTAEAWARCRIESLRPGVDLRGLPFRGTGCSWAGNGSRSSSVPCKRDLPLEPPAAMKGDGRSSWRADSVGCLFCPRTMNNLGQASLSATSMFAETGLIANIRTVGRLPAWPGYNPQAVAPTGVDTCPAGP